MWNRQHKSVKNNQPMNTNTIEIFVPDPELKQSDFSVYRKVGTIMQYARRIEIPKRLLDSYFGLPLSQRDNFMLQIVRTYGIDKQLDMVMEECAELIVAVNKVKRAPNNNLQMDAIDSMLSEVADVQNMIDQICVMFNAHAKVKQIQQDKLERIKTKMLEQNTATP